jgi:hypothetical protein
VSYLLVLAVSEFSEYFGYAHATYLVLEPLTLSRVLSLYQQYFAAIHVIFVSTLFVKINDFNALHVIFVSTLFVKINDFNPSSISILS